MRKSRAVVGFWLMHCLRRPAELVDAPLQELFERARRRRAARRRGRDLRAVRGPPRPRGAAGAPDVGQAACSTRRDEGPTPARSARGRTARRRAGAAPLPHALGAPPPRPAARPRDAGGAREDRRARRSSTAARSARSTSAVARAFRALAEADLSGDRPSAADPTRARRAVPPALLPLARADLAGHALPRDAGVEDAARPLDLPGADRRPAARRPRRGRDQVRRQRLLLRAHVRPDRPRPRS